MIDEQKALDLIALGEGQYVEFKESVPSKVRELSEEVCAFSNASGGFVLIGINNKVTMFVIQMKNALRGLSAPAAWQTPEKFFI